MTYLEWADSYTHDAGVVTLEISWHFLLTTVGGVPDLDVQEFRVESV